MSVFDPKQRNTLGGQIGIALYRVSQAIDFLLRERAKTMRLSPAQIQALLFLKDARPGVRTIGGLAERLRVTYATSSGIADALERAGSAEREKIREALTKTDITSGPALITGYQRIKFDETGQNTFAHGVISQNLDGKRVPIWPAENRPQGVKPVWPIPAWAERK